jgi:hypothetical protein
MCRGKRGGAMFLSGVDVVVLLAVTLCLWCDYWLRRQAIERDNDVLA